MMQAIALVHRWTGGIAGLLLAIMGLSGALLVWKDSWVSVAGAETPLRSSTADLGRAVDVAASGGDLSYITFADENFGLHQAIYRDESGAYLDQGGQVVERWVSQWERPELWLFDLHHYLFAGDTGELVVGGLGLLLLGFSITGAVLWWRTRRTFRLRLLPPRMTRPAIVRQHRDIGMVALPVLLLIGATGSLMAFKPLAAVVLSPLGSLPPRPEAPPVTAAPPAQPDWTRALANAQAAFPDAAIRRLQMPRDPAKAATIRLRQPFEWTPNGRTYVYVDLATAAPVGIVDPAVQNSAQAVQDTFYPLHSGKVGGIVWKLALTAGGLILVLLGTLAVWSFWFADRRKRPVGPVGTEASQGSWAQQR